jgi:hypothetical protein
MTDLSAEDLDRALQPEAMTEPGHVFRSSCG